jgi:hypothetical protein
MAENSTLTISAKRKEKNNSIIIPSHRYEIHNTGKEYLNGMSLARTTATGNERARTVKTVMPTLWEWLPRLVVLKNLTHK